MKKKTLDILLQLRQYELECEQFKLYQKQKEEADAFGNVQAARNAIERVYQEGNNSPFPSDAVKSLNYLKELTAAHQICIRKHGLTKEAVDKQIVVTLDRHKRKEMFVRMKDSYMEAVRVEFDKQERLLLDDVGQSAFTRQLKEVI